MGSNEIDNGRGAESKKPRGVKSAYKDPPEHLEAKLKKGFKKGAKVWVSVSRDGEEQKVAGTVLDTHTSEAKGWMYEVMEVLADGKSAKIRKPDGNTWFVEEDNEVEEDRRERKVEEQTTGDQGQQSA